MNIIRKSSLKACQVVEGVMKYFARELGYAEEADFWDRGIIT